MYFAHDRTTWQGWAGMGGLRSMWSQPGQLTWGLLHDPLSMALSYGWQAVLAVSGELSQACEPASSFPPIWASPWMAWSSSQHGGWLPRVGTPESKMEVHSVFMILPCKSYSTTSTTLCLSRCSQPSPQDQREERETLLLSEMTVISQMSDIGKNMWNERCWFGHLWKIQSTTVLSVLSPFCWWGYWALKR